MKSRLNERSRSSDTGQSRFGKYLMQLLGRTTRAAQDINPREQQSGRTGSPKIKQRRRQQSEGARTAAGNQRGAKRGGSRGGIECNRRGGERDTEESRGHYARTIRTGTAIYGPLFSA